MSKGDSADIGAVHQRLGTIEMQLANMERRLAGIEKALRELAEKESGDLLHRSAGAHQRAIKST